MTQMIDQSDLYSSMAAPAAVDQEVKDEQEQTKEALKLTRKDKKIVKIIEAEIEQYRDLLGIPTVDVDYNTEVPARFRYVVLLEGLLEKINEA